MSVAQQPADTVLPNDIASSHYGKSCVIGGDVTATSAKRSMLFISAELPYPANAGGRLNSWKMIQNFCKEYDLSVACPLKYGEDYLPEFQASLPFRDLIVEPVIVPRSAKNLVISYLKGIPLNVYRTWSAELSQRIEDIADDYDIIFLDHYETMQYLPKSYKGKVLLHEHNATYQLWEGFAKRTTNSAYRMVTSLEAVRVKAYECSAGQRVDLTFACKNDIESLVTAGFERSKCRLHPHAGEDGLLDFPPLQFSKTEEALLYIGSLNWAPNVEALLEFISVVWPKLKQQYPNLKYYIVGASADERLVNACALDVDLVLTGYIENLEPYYARARVFVVPMTYGSGTKIKILNSMARGLPAITTPTGAAGISSDHYHDLVVAASDEEMLLGISQLLEDEARWYALSDNGQRVITEHHRWDHIMKNINRDIGSVFDIERSSIT